MTHAGAEQRSLAGAEKRVVALLGVPTLALALAVTVVTTYLPAAAREFVGSDVVIGVIIGFEGLIALCRSTGTVAAAALVFFIGYFLAHEPYRALYPDAVGEEVAGRARARRSCGAGWAPGSRCWAEGCYWGWAAARRSSRRPRSTSWPSSPSASHWPGAGCPTARGSSPAACTKRRGTCGT